MLRKEIGLYYDQHISYSKFIIEFKLENRIFYFGYANYWRLASGETQRRLAPASDNGIYSKYLPLTHLHFTATICKIFVIGKSGHNVVASCEF